MIKDIIIEIRPKQWIKNLFVLAALVFSRKFIYMESVIQSLSSFVSFILASSAIYMVNDIFDIEKDRNHPVKSKRPIASGKIKCSTAWIVAVGLGGLSLVVPLTPLIWGYPINANFYLILISYILLMIWYSVGLKNRVILDVMAVASGFVLRAIAGAVAISVKISGWFFFSALLLSLFLALVKRRQEILMNQKSAHRKVLKHYSPQFIDQMISIVCASTIVTYLLYTMDRTSTFLLPVTVVFVIYGIFRYLYIIHQYGGGEEPEKIIFSDIPFLINLTVYVTFVMIIIIFNPEVFK